MENGIPLTLYTDRLILRALSPQDAEALFRLRSNESVNQFIGRNAPVSLEDVERFIDKINTSVSNNESGYWAVCLKDRSELAGTICLWNFSADRSYAELGYELHPDFQGRGIMLEATAAILDVAFDKIHLKKIEAWTDARNVASTKLLNRLGFIRDLAREGEEGIKNVLENNHIYSLER